MGTGRDILIDRGYLFTFAGEALRVHELGALGAPVAVHRGFTRRAPIAGRSTTLAEGVLVVGGYDREVVVYDFRELTQEPVEVLRLPATTSRALHCRVTVSGYT